MIRAVEQRDHEAIQAIHGSDGFDYPAPDLSDPLFVRAFAEEEEGRLRGALAARLTMEMYLFLAPGDAEKRWGTFLALHDAMAEEMKRIRVGEVHCFLPPEIEKRFGRRLESLGWVREWSPYRYELDGREARCESIT